MGEGLITGVPAKATAQGVAAQEVTRSKYEETVLSVPPVSRLLDSPYQFRRRSCNVNKGVPVDNIKTENLSTWWQSGF